MPPFLNGLIFGLIFLVSLGPAFFALIQTSIQHGFKKAIFFAIGISLSDMFFVMITILGLASFMESDDFRLWMGIFGSAMLFGYAIYTWVKSPAYKEVEMSNDVNYIKHLLKGLLLNGLNPFILVVWATWISAVAVNFSYNFSDQLQFFTGMLLCILSMDIGKAFIAHRLKHLITTKFIRSMNRIVGIIMAIFAVRIVYFLIENYYW